MNTVKGTATQNVALLGLAVAVLTPWLEKHYGLKVSVDDLVDYIGGATLAWHTISKTLGPYAQRIFDHFFPEPAAPAPQSKE